MKKVLLAIMWTVIAIVLFVVLLVLSLVLFEPVIYRDFYADSRSEFSLPGGGDGFVQQGFAYTGGKFLTSGYMHGFGPSRVYVTDEDGQHKYIRLRDHNEELFFGHVGGLSVYNDSTVFICGDEAGQMLVYSLADILGADDGASVSAQSDFTVACSTSFCYVEGNTLYVGEFYREQNYAVTSASYPRTPADTENHAVILGYTITPEPFSVSSTPYVAYSVPDLAQGMCITESGDIVISTSYGFASSRLSLYKLPESTTGTITINGNTIPYWPLNSNTLSKYIYAPPMSEELVYLNGRIYVMGESASNKYMFGKILRARDVWSIVL